MAITGTIEQRGSDLPRHGGRWLKEKREHAGLSQRELAERSWRGVLHFHLPAGDRPRPHSPDRYQVWAKRCAWTRAIFVSGKLMRFYDPVTYGILFPSDGENAGRRLIR